MAPSPLHQHPRYRLEELLGRGASSDVWRALDRSSGEFVALKALRSASQADRLDFEREIRTLSRLHHPSIVRFHDVGHFRGELYFTMELVRGVSLAESPANPSTPDVDEIAGLARILAEALDALDHVHRNHLVHADLKPTNILVLGGVPGGDTGVALRDGRPRVKLVDFGLAREPATTAASMATKGRENVVGTLLYLAPEVLSGHPCSVQSDLYAIGALLYQLVTSRPVYATVSQAIARRAPPTPAGSLHAGCPQELDDLLDALLQKEPADRPRSARAVADTLRNIGDTGETASGKTAPRLRRPVFVGRETELARLRESLATRLSSGRGGILRLEGERGAGKTWILDESGFRGGAFLDHGARSVRASFRATSAPRRGLAVVFRELLDDLLTQTDLDIPAELGPWTGELVDAWGIGPRDEHSSTPTKSTAAIAVDDATARERILQTGLRVIVATARRAPCFIALEDLQDCDELEADMLAWISRSIRELPVLLLVTYRPQDIEHNVQAREWLTELDSMDEPSPLSLGGLADHEVRLYAESMLTPYRSVDDRITRDLLHDGGARPLAVHGRLRQLVDRDAIALHDGCWSLTGALPSLTENGQNAAPPPDLSPEQLRVLATAAVVETPVNEPVLMELLDATSTPPGPLGAALESLIRDGWLIEEPDGLQLSPEIGREMLLERLPDHERSDLHAREAKRLTRRASLNDLQHLRVAEHLVEAGDPGRACRHYLEAARITARSYSNQRAQAAFTRALELADSGPLRAKIALEIGTLHVRVGEYPEALARFRLAESLQIANTATSRQRIRLRDRIGRVLHRQGRLDDARGCFTTCAEEAGESGEALALAHYRLGSVSFDENDLTTAREHFQRSLTLYGSEAPPESLAPVHLGLGLVYKLEKHPQAAIASFEKALSTSQACGQLVDAARIQGNLGNLHRASGETDLAVDYLRQSTAIRELVGDRQGLAICLNNMARVQVHRGEYDAAHDATTRALNTFDKIGDSKGVLIARCNLGEILLGLGKPTKARTILEEALPPADELSAARMRESILCNLSRVELVSGRLDLAEKHARDCLRSTPSDRLRGLQAQALATLAEAFLDAGRTEDASDALRDAWSLIEDDQAFEKRAEIASILVRLRRMREELDEALEFALLVIENDTGSDERYGRARLDLALGCVYRDLGPDWADRTEKHLNRAVRAFEAMGCRVESAESLGELAVYWWLVEEEKMADECATSGEAHLASPGLEYRRRRLKLTLRAGAS